MKEYKRYVNQFKPLSVFSSRLPKIATFKRSHEKHHPDFDIFQAYVQSAAPNASKQSLQAVIDTRDEDIYQRYVAMSGEGVGDADEKANVRNESEEVRYEGYAQWIATGRFQ
ncbi:hypothetical protein HDU98_011546 [Podochytrium sp. JEL0797]|nr:hypothetical protein HDU98_011546 [Podochytrium sp. JEL0797]